MPRSILHVQTLQTDPSFKMNSKQHHRLAPRSIINNATRLNPLHSQDHASCALLIQLPRTSGLHRPQLNGDQPCPCRLRSPAFPIPLQPSSSRPLRGILPLLHRRYLEIHSVLVVYFLCGYPCYCGCLCYGHPMPKLEDLLGSPDHIPYHRRIRSFLSWEYRRWNVSGLSLHYT